MLLAIPIIFCWGTVIQYLHKSCVFLVSMLKKQIPCIAEIVKTAATDLCETEPTSEITCTRRLVVPVLFVIQLVDNQPEKDRLFYYLFYKLLVK